MCDTTPKCDSKESKSRSKKGLTGREVYTKVKDAIVEVVSVRAPNVTETPQFIQGSGFFVKCGQIVTAARNVLDPCPDLNPGLNRRGRIFVRVFNVNNSGKSYLYEALLDGADGAGDIALLKIEKTLPWNESLPCVQSHAYLKFDPSRCACIGDTVYAIGNPGCLDARSFTHGVIRDNAYVDPAGTALEAVLTDIPFYEGYAGGPILNTCGNVIGLFTHCDPRANTEECNGNTITGGPAQQAAEPIIRALLEPKNNPHVAEVKSSLGDFNRYVKGFLGVVFDLYSTCELLEEFTQPDGTIIQPAFLQVGRGFLVRLITNPERFEGKLLPDDLIVCIEGLPLGDTPPAVAPSAVLWQTLPEQKVKIFWRTRASNYAECQSLCVTLGEWPCAFDFPGAPFTLLSAGLAPSAGSTGAGSTGGGHSHDDDGSVTDDD